jgi:hypothetical protein
MAAHRAGRHGLERSLFPHQSFLIMLVS